MDILLIFSFILVAGLFALLAKSFNARSLMLIGFLILLFLGLDVLRFGYNNSFIGTQTTTSQFNYTYYANSNSNEVTGMNLTKNFSAPRQQDDFTQMFGWVLIIFALVVGYLGVLG